MPKQKIKIEVVNIPAYSREPRALQQHYDFLPDGYADLLVMTESMDEIIADKLVSLVCCTRHIRYRDIWDLRWLKQQGAMVNIDFVRKKILDYGERGYALKLDIFSKNLDDIIHSKEFHAEMSRFIPLEVQERTLKKEKFLGFLYSEIHALLQQVRSSFVTSLIPT